MKFCLYIDESGDHGLTQVNTEFPVFLLCGILMEEQHYPALRDSINEVKSELWGNKQVIFHSRDIRKHEKEFCVLFDLSVKEKFYNGINRIIAGNNYAVIASAIKKDAYIERFGRLSDDVYEIALSFIIERAVFFLNELAVPDKELEIIIERRGAREDKKLEEHFQRLLARGTAYVSADTLRTYNLNILFKSKRENINGLQLADLVAYPVARYVIDPERANPAFELIISKIYIIKIYP